MRPLIFLLFLSFGFSTVFAQDEDEEAGSKKFCSEELSKKAIESYQKGIDKKKYKKPERLEFLKKAIDLEPDFAEAHLAMAMELVARSRLESKPFTQTLPFFYKAIGSCPNIHSDPYYYLGFDYYERRLNDSAQKYLQKFVDFKDADMSKFAKEWNNQMYQAKMMLKSIKKENSLKKGVPFDPRVVSGVSTERDEYLAYISPDDQNCFFVRRVPVQNKNQVYASDKEKEVFMVAQRDKTGVFNQGEPMEPPFNTTDDNQGGCSISIDNRCLYFAMMRQEGGPQPNCDIYISESFDGMWGEIRKLSPDVNDGRFWDSQPSISSDGVTLYFASDRPGGFGGIDLYVTTKDPKTNKWSQPKNLGPQINTPDDEKTPFIHSDSETLYFSSNGHFGFGGYDIFYVKKNEKGEWLEPENIGSPINSDSDDTGFFVSTDTRTGYFFSFAHEGKVRGRGVGRYDLYGFELYKEARPQQVALVKGTVKDSSGNQVSGAIVELKDLKTRKTSYATVDSASGEYMVAIKRKNDVVLTVKKDGIAFNVKNIKAKELPAEIKPQEINIEVREAKQGGSFVIDNILYNTNSADLEADSKIIVEGFAEYLKDNPKIKVEIQGHTDNVGNPKDNDALSSNRAFTVKSLLEELGVAADRVTAKGFGAHKPIASNATEEGRAKNRRTEFQILAK
jgi:outer membrane protein OmpA-like peptidoglycan-associated protein